MPALSPLLWVALAVVAVALAGLVAIARAHARLRQKLTLAVEFRSQVDAFLEEGNRDTYEWLTLHATRMQAQMGSEGIVTFRPPHANYVVNNYPIVVNALSELRKCLTDDMLSRGNLPHQYHALIDDALLRHQGTLTERLRLNGKSLRNPLQWAAFGTQWLLSLPLWFMASLGIISRSSATHLVASAVFRIVAGVAAAVGFISAIVGLVTGWEQFISIARKVLPGAF